MISTYSMYCCTVGDKEIVFLMDGKQANPHPTVDTLHVSVNNLISSLNGDNNNSGMAGFSSLEEVFRAMDLNGDGNIDSDEFNKGVNALGLDWTPKQTNKLFNQIDTNGTGNITFNNFMKVMMKPSNKRSWKELKRAINSSINMPNVKGIKNSNLTTDQYQKKLSQMEKLVNMMEESMIESDLANEEQMYWRNVCKYIILYYILHIIYIFYIGIFILYLYYYINKIYRKYALIESLLEDIRMLLVEQ